MRYAKLDSDGYVLSITGGHQPDDTWVEYPDGAPPLGFHRVRLVDGEYVVTGETIAPPPQYDKSRADEYPPVGDQLDAIWKALAPLIESGEAESMLRRIQAVKNKYPKQANSK